MTPADSPYPDSRPARVIQAWRVWRRRNQTDENGRYPDAHWTVYLRGPVKWPTRDKPVSRG